MRFLFMTVMGGERLRELSTRRISTMLNCFSSFIFITIRLWPMMILFWIFWVTLYSTSFDRWTQLLINGVTAGLTDPRLWSLFKSTKADDAKESQEIKREERNQFDRQLGIIHTSLSSLRLAVKGKVLMSEQLEEVYDALLSISSFVVSF